jgi:hypothetical protein
MADQEASGSSLKSSRGPYQVLADLLLIRHPGKLMLDGLVLIALCYILNILILWKFGPGWSSMSVDSPLISGVLSYLGNWLWYAGLAVMSVAGVRILGAAIGGRRGHE